MSGLSRMRDIGAFITSRFAGFVAVTAGGGADGAEVDGVWIDRQGYESLKEVLTFETTLADTETLSLAANIQDADDDSGTNAADFGDALANAVVATGETGGTTEQGTAELDVDLSGARRYIRVQFTPTMSAGTTDTASVAATHVLGGAAEVPAS